MDNYSKMSILHKRSLINDLMDRTELLQESIKRFIRLSEDEMNYTSVFGEYSIGENIDQLASTQQVYLDLINRRLDKARLSRATDYQSGWLGEWVYSVILPQKDGTLQESIFIRYLTPPKSGLSGKKAIEQFLLQIEEIQQVLNYAQSIDIEYPRIPLPFNRLLSLKLGDCLRFLIAYGERHILLCNRLYEEIILSRRAIAV